MMEATQITISYDEIEDRIFVDTGDGRTRARLILTRRITHRLLGAFIALLERSSLAVTRAPADLRAEVIAFEHLSAISHSEEQDTPASPAPLSPATGAPDATVIAKVDVQVAPQSFRLLFHSSEEAVAGLTLSRPNFHKILAALDRFAAAAEWNIRGDAEWLGATNPNAAGRVAS
jgi:hypothetical protein